MKLSITEKTPAGEYQFGKRKNKHKNVLAGKYTNNLGTSHCILYPNNYEVKFRLSHHNLLLFNFFI